MMRRYILIALALGACVRPPNEKTQDGPTITVKLKPPSGFGATSDDSSPYLSLGTGATSYTFQFIITTNRGETYDGNKYTHPDVTKASGTVQLAGANIPAIMLDVDTTQSEWTYTGHDMISVPSSFKGQKLTVHGDAHDANGLSSNLVDFMVSLQ